MAFCFKQTAAKYQYTLMLSYFFQGIITGLILSVAIGPVFFMLISISLTQGFKKAMVLESGIILGDLFCIIIAIWGLQAVLTKIEYRQIMTISGGIILMIFGIITWLKSKPKSKNQDDLNIEESNLRLFVKGFLFNISNPSVIFFWMAAVGLAISEFDNNSYKVFPYFAGTLITVFSIDVLKAYLAFNIKRFLTPGNLIRLNQGAGIAIGVFGFIVLLKGLKGI